MGESFCLWKGFIFLSVIFPGWSIVCAETSILGGNWIVFWRIEYEQEKMADTGCYGSN